MTRENFPSFIPAEKIIPELTIKAILVGVFLAIVLGAANAYLGLYAGMTVSAIIPGVVMALALMKPFKPTILEVNIATMGASAGECIAAGVIFTIPALILVGAWTEIHYLETTFISLIGGILGVLWMVPLRRALVVKTNLPFPEGIAVAAVLTTTVGGQQVGKKERVSGIWLTVGALIAALFKFGQLSLNLFRDTIDGIVSIGKYAIFGEKHEAWFYGGTTLSPALLAVGWIIGPRISSYVLVGGLLGWVIITPLLILVTGLPSPTPEYTGLGNIIGGFYTIWGEQVRYIGVGAMLIGGLWAVYSIRTNLVDSVKETVMGLRKQGYKKQKRTEQDMNYKLVFIAIGVMVLPIFVLYQLLSGLMGISIIMAILTIFLAFIASALAGLPYRSCRLLQLPYIRSDSYRSYHCQLTYAWSRGDRTTRNGDRHFHLRSRLHRRINLWRPPANHGIWSNDWSDTKKTADLDDLRCSCNLFSGRNRYQCITPGIYYWQHETSCTTSIPYERNRARNSRRKYALAICGRRCSTRINLNPYRTTGSSSCDRNLSSIYSFITDLPRWRYTPHN